MLVLKRRVGERLLLQTSDGPIWITLVFDKNGYTRIGLDAPTAVKISREELLPESQRYHPK